jgi:hypothetical protein
MRRNYLCLLITILLVGCAHPRASSTIKEKRLIQPDEGITIFWDVGGFTDDPEITGYYKVGFMVKNLNPVRTHFLNAPLIKMGIA